VVGAARSGSSLAHVVDRLVIEAVLVRYDTLIDTKQVDRLREVFSADAVVGRSRGAIAYGTFELLNRQSV
jgi:hypothetical protein